MIYGACYALKYILRKAWGIHTCHVPLTLFVTTSRICDQNSTCHTSLDRAYKYLSSDTLVMCPASAARLQSRNINLNNMENVYMWKVYNPLEGLALVHYSSMIHQYTRIDMLYLLVCMAALISQCCGNCQQDYTSLRLFPCAWAMHATSLIYMCAFCAQASSTHQCGSNDIWHMLCSCVCLEK